MEVLSRLLEEAACNNPDFHFHPKCSALKLTHICFVHDLLIFSAAKISSLRVLNGVLAEFEGLSGLKSNPAKSSLFIVGLPQVEKNVLLEFMQFLKGLFRLDTWESL
jgi:hypothetical protein